MGAPSSGPSAERTSLPRPSAGRVDGAPFDDYEIELDLCADTDSAYWEHCMVMIVLGEHIDGVWEVGTSILVGS